MWSCQVAMHFKLKVNYTISITKLKLKSKNKTFGIPKVYQSLKMVLVNTETKANIKFLYQDNTKFMHCF